MQKTITVYLIGLPGVGKYTLAKEIAQHGYVMVDNHCINNPVFTIAPPSDTMIPEAQVWQAINAIRQAIFSLIEMDTTRNYVLTNELLVPDSGIFNAVQEMAEKRKSIFVPIVLALNQAVHHTRIQSEGRKEAMKLTDPKALIGRVPLEIIHENLLNLDITDLSKEAVVLQILRHVETCVQKAGCHKRNPEPYASDVLVVEIAMPPKEVVINTLRAGVLAESYPYLGWETIYPFTLTLSHPKEGFMGGVSGSLCGAYVRIDLAWVKKEVRKKGLGTRLFTEVETFARKRCCKAIHLSTYDFQARPFYEKLGFSCIGTIYQAVEGRDSYFMRKILI